MFNNLNEAIANTMHCPNLPAPIGSENKATHAEVANTPALSANDADARQNCEHKHHILGVCLPAEIRHDDCWERDERKKQVEDWQPVVGRVARPD